MYSPTPENRRGFAAQMQAELDLRVEAVESIQEAIDGADIIAITAGNYQPIAALEGLRPGALVTSIVGRSIPGISMHVPGWSYRHLLDLTTMLLAGTHSHSG